MSSLKSWLNWKSWAVAFVLATGAFWMTMAKNPPTSIAADTAGFSPLELTIPSHLPIAEGGNTF